MALPGAAPASPGPRHQRRAGRQQGGGGEGGEAAGLPGAANPGPAVGRALPEPPQRRPEGRGGERGPPRAAWGGPAAWQGEGSGGREGTGDGGADTGRLLGAAAAREGAAGSPREGGIGRFPRAGSPVPKFQAGGKRWREETPPQTEEPLEEIVNGQHGDCGITSSPGRLEDVHE